LSKSREWLNQLKTAIVQEDFQSIERLTKDSDVFSEFETLEELNEAKYLLKEALLLSLNTREEIGAKMEKISKNIENIRNSISNSFYKFDKRF